MLTLTRRVGETIYIGDDICVTVYDKLRYHLMMGVLAPPSATLDFGGSSVRPVALPDGVGFYLLTLLNRDAFTVGEARVSVRFKPSFLGVATLRAQQVRVGIAAPRSIEVHREEVYARKLLDSGRRCPVVSLPEWLRRANLSVSCRAAA